MTNVLVARSSDVLAARFDTATCKLPIWGFDQCGHRVPAAGSGCGRSKSGNSILVPWLICINLFKLLKTSKMSNIEQLESP